MKGDSRLTVDMIDHQARDILFRSDQIRDETPAVLRLAGGEIASVPWWLGWSLCALLAGVATAGLVTMGIMTQDEGELLTYPWLIAHGSVPYRDIFMQYPPATFVLL